MAGKASEVQWLFTRQTLSLFTQHHIRVALRMMVRRGFRHLPIIDESRRVLGILSAQDLIKKLYRAGVKNFDSTLNLQVQEIMSREPEFMIWNEGLIDAIRKMERRNIGALPIVDFKSILRGIITLRDLISFMGAVNERIGVYVKDIMTPNPVIVDPETTVNEAMGLMAANGIRRVIVASDGKAVGMASNKGILRFLEGVLSYGYLDPSEALKASISKLMDIDIVTVEREDDARTVAYNMVIYGVGGLVVGKDEIVGIVTERDLINRLYRLKGGEFMMWAVNPREDISERPNW